MPMNSPWQRKTFATRSWRTTCRSAIFLLPEPLPNWTDCVKATPTPPTCCAKPQNKTSDPGLRAGLNRIEAIDQEWYTTVAERFVQQHKEVESGQMKAMDLLDRYTETYPTDQLKRFNEVIDEVQTEDRSLIQRTTENSEWFRAGHRNRLLGFLLSLGLGIFIAFRTANAITNATGEDHQRGPRDRRQGRSRPGD